MHLNNKNRTSTYRVISVLLAIAGAIGVQGVMANEYADSIRYTNSMMSVFVFVAGGIILSRILPVFVGVGRREQGYSLAFSVVLSIALHVGARMEASDAVRLTDISMWMRSIVLALFLTPVVAYLWDMTPRLFTSSLICDGSDTKKEKFSILSIWLIIFVLWIPTFLALYPGAFVYDAQEEYVEVISRTFTTHHPLIHVLALGGTVHAAEYLGFEANTGIAIYVLIQMLIFSWILAYSVRCLYRWGLKKGYCFAVMLTYGLFPIFPMYAVCTAKDTLFSGCLLLIVLLLTDYIKSFNMNTVLFIAASVLMMMFRNNGMYAYIVAVPVTAVLLLIGLNGKSDGEVMESGSSSGGKRDRWNPIVKVVVLMILSIVMASGLNVCLKLATQATSGEHQEILTVPIQQLTRVYTYNKEVFTQDELETLYEVLPEEYLQTYSLRVSDIVKSGFNNPAYEKNPGKYRRLWIDIGLRKPLVYINAWLGTSYGYWYPDALNNVYKGNQMYTFQYDKSSFFGFETEPPGHRDSKFSLLEKFYEHISLDLYQQKVPIVSMMFSPGCMFWIFMLTFVGLLMRGRRCEGINGYLMAVPLSIVALVWLTVLLGPTTLVRYVLILWLIVPVLPVYVISEGVKKNVQ